MLIGGLVENLTAVRATCSDVDAQHSASRGGHRTRPGHGDAPSTDRGSHSTKAALDRGRKAGPFVAYQAMQWKAAEKAMAKAKLLASFIGTEPGEAVFAGLFEVRGHRALERGEYGRIPENVELIALGMQGRAAEFDGGLLFDLVQSQTYVEWQGRLIIRWPPPERLGGVGQSETPCRWRRSSKKAASRRGCPLRISCR